MKRIEGLDLKGKKVLIRVDFNVPIEDGEISDFTKIKNILKAKKLYDNAKQIIFMSHLGRPQKELNNFGNLEEVKKKFTLKPVADYLSDKLNDFSFVKDCLQKRLPNSKFVLLENLRFYPEEEKNDSEFARRLSHNADIYVNDAFGACHRRHASVIAVAEYFKEQGKDVAAGKLLQKEDKNLKRLFNAEKPFVLFWEERRFLIRLMQ